MAEARACGINRFVTVLHPLAYTLPSASLGDGCFVASMAKVATRAQVGHQVFLFHNTYVGHHSRVEDYVTIGPGAFVESFCLVREGAYVGMRALILPHVTVGRNAVVAAGAVVTKDVTEHCLVTGVPAAVKKEGIPGYRGG